ncbi:hypothetical protein Tco_1546426 [Tanacetum coccineum]
MPNVAIGGPKCTSPRSWGVDSSRWKQSRKFQRWLRRPMISEPTSAYTHHAEHKFHEVFQMKHGGGYSDLPASKISTDKASYQWISGYLTPAVTSGGVNRSEVEELIVDDSSYTKGWMSFVKHSETAPVCHSKPLDSVKNWNDHFFWVDSTVFPLSVSLKSKILSKDPPPKLSQYDTEACEFLRTHTSPFWKFSEPFLCWVGISRYYTLDENSYPTFWDGEKEMDLFAFICHSDPTKVRVGERNLTKRKVKLLKMNEGRIVPLNPHVAAASGGSDDSVDKMFDEGDDANQEHLVERDDDVLEEVVALDASRVGAEKAKKRRKRKATGDASGSDYPPKKLRDDYQPLPPPTGGKSLSALREMIPEGFAIPSDVMGPLSTASATPVSDVGPVDFVSGLNLWTHPPHERYVISPDSSHHSDSYSEAASLVRSVADVSVVMIAVTTNIATGSKAKDVPKGFENIGDFASTGGIEADAVSISKLKKPSISSDSFYASQSLNTETLHRVYVPRWKVTNDSVLDDPYVCRDMTDHLAPCAIYTGVFEGGEIAHLRSLLSLKEAEAAEAISLRGQLTVLEATDAAKGAELRDLKKKDFSLEREKNVVKLTADLSILQLSHDELNSKVVSLESEMDCLATQRSSLESAFEIFKEQVEKMQDEQVGLLSDRVAAIDSDLVEMVLYMDAEFYPRYLTTIARRRWILSRGLKLVLAKCLSSPEYLSAMGEAIGRAVDKGMQDGLAAGIEHGIAGRSIRDVAEFNPSAESDYIDAINALQGGPAAETSEAHQLQPSLDQLMIPIHRLEDQVIIRETSLAFSLEVAHNRVQRLRGDATAHRLSLTDSILPLVEPLSAKNLTGEESSSVGVATAVTTALLTTFAQTYPVLAMLSPLVPPSPKVVFKE